MKKKKIEIDENPKFEIFKLPRDYSKSNINVTLSYLVSAGKEYIRFLNRAWMLVTRRERCRNRNVNSAWRCRIVRKIGEVGASVTGVIHLKD